MIESVKELLEPENQCPECKGKLTWKVIRSTFGNPVYNGLCSKCNIIFRDRKVPDHVKGQKLAEIMVGVDCMDERITSNNGDVQIGLLRARQHCETCGYPYYPITPETECKCVDCKCLYCEEYK